MLEGRHTFSKSTGSVDLVKFFFNPDGNQQDLGRLQKPFYQLLSHILVTAVLGGRGRRGHNSTLPGERAPVFLQRHRHCVMEGHPELQGGGMCSGLQVDLLVTPL